MTEVEVSEIALQAACKRAAVREITHVIQAIHPKEHGNALLAGEWVVSLLRSDKHETCIHYSISIDDATGEVTFFHANGGG